MFNILDEKLIDFTEVKRRQGGYIGANGKKIPVEYENEVYMLKFPGVAKINDNMHYTNGGISEYIGCHIFDEIGIPVQKTLLGKYLVNGEYKLVVACKDFTFIEEIDDTIELMDFVATKNTVIDSPRSGKGTELADVLDAINMQSRLDPEIVLKRFWDMFVVDAFIGNWDRHNGNWGMLYVKKTDTVLGLAPVFDCGSSLYPQADETIMKSVLANSEELKLRVYERPLSALMVDGKKINYYSFMTSSNDRDFISAVIRIVPRINMEGINKIIEETPGIDDLSKSFYKTILKARKELILDESLKYALSLDENRNSVIKRNRGR